MRWCWVNFQCRGVLLIWNRVGQEPTALALGVGGGCLDIISLVYHFSFLSPSLWETARYRLKYCLKGLLSPKQPTNHPRQIFTTYDCIFVSVVFVVLCHVSCLWVTGVESLCLKTTHLQSVILVQSNAVKASYKLD